jgi:RNA-directed DNA polymerase
VYCKDANRRGSHEHTSFTFLGYTFRPRLAQNRNGQIYASFTLAASKDALKAMGQQIRRWRINKRTSADLAEIASWINPIVRGWMNYYGRFRRSEIYRLLQRINTYLMPGQRQDHVR